MRCPGCWGALDWVYHLVIKLVSNENVASFEFCVCRVSSLFGDLFLVYFIFTESGIFGQLLYNRLAETLDASTIRPNRGWSGADRRRLDFLRWWRLPTFWGERRICTMVLARSADHNLIKMLNFSELRPICSQKFLFSKLCSCIHILV